MLLSTPYFPLKILIAVICIQQVLFFNRICGEVSINQLKQLSKLLIIYCNIKTFAVYLFSPVYNVWLICKYDGQTDGQTMCTVAVEGQNTPFCILIVFLCDLLNQCHVWSWLRLKEALCFFLECSAFQLSYRVNIARNRKRPKLASRQNLNGTKIKLHKGNRQSAFDPPF